MGVMPEREIDKNNPRVRIEVSNEENFGSGNMAARIRLHILIAGRRRFELVLKPDKYLTRTLQIKSRVKLSDRIGWSSIHVRLHQRDVLDAMSGDDTCRGSNI